MPETASVAQYPVCGIVRLRPFLRPFLLPGAFQLFSFDPESLAQRSLRAILQASVAPTSPPQRRLAMITADPPEPATDQLRSVEDTTLPSDSVFHYPHDTE